MKPVVHIFGASGSGTTTLAKAVSQRNGFFLSDTDDYLWAPTDPPFTTKRGIPERVRLMRRDVDAAKTGVVISGSLIGWGDPLIPCFTLAVRLHVPREIRLKRLRDRESARFGDRILPGGDMFETHRAFLEWAAAYDDNTVIRCQKNHDAWQKTLPCPVLGLDGTLPVDTLVDAVLSELNKGAVV